MGTTAAEQGDSLKDSFGKLFAVLGFGGAGWGGMNMWKKTQQGENSRITGTQIWGPLLGGAALGATGFMMTTAGETVGIAAGQQGVVPG
ncbi:TraR protein [Pseudomonas syringae pv. cilantro]|nr:TraR protein [Pseudomonas syringae pv. cilantro]